jgi:hypothetical protein
VIFTPGRFSSGRAGFFQLKFLRRNKTFGANRLSTSSSAASLAAFAAKEFPASHHKEY